MPSLVSFGKFLWSGSINSQLEQLDTKTLSIAMKKVATTVFKRNDFTLMDFNHLQRNKTNQIIGEKCIQPNGHYYIYPIDNQASFIAPDIDYYKNESLQFRDMAQIGTIIAGSLALAFLGLALAAKNKEIIIRLGFWASRLVRLIPSYNSLAVGMGSSCLAILVFLQRGSVAHTFYKNFRSFLSDSDFQKHAVAIKEMRNLSYAYGENKSINMPANLKKSSKDLAYLLSQEQALSSSEREVFELESMYQKIKKEVSIEDVLNTDALRATSPTTPEFQAIQAYLKEISSIEWINIVVGHFKQSIKERNLANFGAIAEALDAIPEAYTTNKCFQRLEKAEQESIISDLEKYLKARKERNDTAVLPKGEDLKGYTSSIKDLVKKEIFELVQNELIPINEIPVESSFWREAAVIKSEWEAAITNSTKKSN